MGLFLFVVAVGAAISFLGVVIAFAMNPQGQIEEFKKGYRGEYTRKDD